MDHSLLVVENDSCCTDTIGRGHCSGRGERDGSPLQPGDSLPARPCCLLCHCERSWSFYRACTSFSECIHAQITDRLQLLLALQVVEILASVDCFIVRNESSGLTIHALEVAELSRTIRLDYDPHLAARALTRIVSVSVSLPPLSSPSLFHTHTHRYRFRN